MEALELVSDIKALVKELSHHWVACVDDLLQHVKELRRHADFVLIYQQLKHRSESSWTSFVESNMNGRRLLVYRILQRVAIYK